MRATRAALQNAAGDLQSSLKSAADIRLWTRKFPWAAVGVAVATGFVAASVVKPAQAASPATPHPTPDPQQDSRPAAAGSLIGTLLRRAADMALQAVVAAATQPSVATDGDEEQPAGFDHNGQTEPAATGSEFSP